MEQTSKQTLNNIICGFFYEYNFYFYLFIYLQMIFTQEPAMLIYAGRLTIGFVATM